MPVLVHSVTNAMVLQRLNVQTSTVASGTTPLSTEDIDAFIEDGASQITAILTNSGRSTDVSGDEDMEAQVQAAIISFAVWKSYDALPSVPQAKVDAARDAWYEERDRYDTVHESLKVQAADRTETNLDTSSTKPPAVFRGNNFEF